MQKHLHLKVELFQSIDQDQIFCKIKCSEENLMNHADLTDYKLQFRKNPFDTKPYMDPPPHAPYERHESGNFGSQAQGLLGGFKSKSVQKEKDLFQKYSRKSGKKLQPGHSEGETLFRYVDRVRLVNDMIIEQIDTSELQNEKLIQAQFPLHNKKQLEEFQTKFSSWKSTFKSVDLASIRNYFGEDIALYFAYLIKYLIWLIMPTILGIIIFILEYTIGGRKDDYTNYTAGDFCVFIYSFILAVAATAYD